MRHIYGKLSVGSREELLALIDAIEETYNKEMDTIAPEMFKRNETDLAYLSADILDA